jgi:hypothetical protein
MCTKYVEILFKLLTHKSQIKHKNNLLFTIGYLEYNIHKLRMKIVLLLIVLDL